MSTFLVMANEKDPNPLSDVARGLGLLFRAARTAARKLPTKDLEEVVLTSAREVGRAFENVATTLERTVVGGKRGGAEHPGPGTRDASAPSVDETGPHDSNRPG